MRTLEQRHFHVGGADEEGCRREEGEKEEVLFQSTIQSSVGSRVEEKG